MARVIVVGAGTFGASLAWWLARAGEEVVLVDQFEPGDRRASSGGETRLIRSGHGEDADYTASARRAWELWRLLEAESGAELLIESGIAWFAHADDGWEARCARTLAAQGIPAERLDPAETAALYPSFAGDDLAFVLLEPEAGVLRAQRAVQTLAAQARAHGARILRGRARPAGSAVRLEGDGSTLEGDAVVWACGGWLGGLFGPLAPVRTTRQDLFFLGGGPAWARPGVPGWIDYDHAVYGTADLDGLGVKAAPDAEGPPLAPDAPLPTTAAANEAATRGYLAARFPALAAAPLTETRTCRYELTADSHFLAGAHPEHPGVWLLGGGSGHGFKHGPAMAERMAAVIAGRDVLPARFALGPRRAGRSLRTAGSGAVAASAA